MPVSLVVVVRPLGEKTYELQNMLKTNGLIPCGNIGVVSVSTLEASSSRSRFPGRVLGGKIVAMMGNGYATFYFHGAGRVVMTGQNDFVRLRLFGA